MPAVCIVLVTWLLMWLAQGVPTVCALVNPCPAPDVRVGPALLFGGLMVVPTAVLIVRARQGRGWDRVSTSSYLVLMGLAVFGLGTVLFSGGFAIPLTF